MADAQPRHRERYLASLDAETSQRPIPWFWEQQPEADDCIDGSGAHQWETVVYHPRGRGWAEDVDRCSRCRTPRCVSRGVDRDDRCTERLHHTTVHIYPSGESAPVGGYLRPEETDRG